MGTSSILGDNPFVPMSSCRLRLRLRLAGCWETYCEICSVGHLTTVNTTEARVHDPLPSGRTAKLRIRDSWYSQQVFRAMVKTTCGWNGWSEPGV